MKNYHVKIIGRNVTLPTKLKNYQARISEVLHFTGDIVQRGKLFEYHLTKWVGEFNFDLHYYNPVFVILTYLTFNDLSKVLESEGYKVELDWPLRIYIDED